MDRLTAVGFNTALPGSLFESTFKRLLLRLRLRLRLRKCRMGEAKFPNPNFHNAWYKKRGQASMSQESHLYIMPRFWLKFSDCVLPPRWRVNS